ncbi:protein FAR1-RELATED SEQUENCE 11-like [Bidens hawaiensis]|uniref:protein FAR1-RELATED SEQUENCE 11-like n=1 Tax=Bidens hawaiensis TaxID=980011 RepID=UPI00404AD1CF
MGIDNHGRTILFGCALLCNEKRKTFEWLFKCPKTILTDQDWMKQAIETEMPYTKHAFCIWLIAGKFSSWFTSVLKSEYSSWCSELYNLYKLESVEEVEQQWPLVIAKFNLKENKHVTSLYQIKTFWFPSYLHGFFFGGMTTTTVDFAIEDVGQKQMHDSVLAKYQKLHLKSLSPLEKQGYQVLTPYAFKKFQYQLSLAIQYSACKENDTSFIVKHYKASRWHKVVWDGKMAECTCKNFEFVGILVRHLLSILLYTSCFEIPFSYWLSRWRREEAQFNNVSQLRQEGTWILHHLL